MTLSEKAVKFICYANTKKMSPEELKDYMPKYLYKKSVIKEAQRILKDIEIKGEWK